MTGENFVKVFDVLDSGFKNWRFPAFGLIFVAIGLGLFFAPRVIKRLDLPYLDLKSKGLKFFRYFFLGFSIFWTATAFLSTYSVYKRHQNLASSIACPTVEGPVENFVPMPYGGHSPESFTVSGVHFSYSDYAAIDGFNHTSSHGGPMTKDAFVRISYDPATHQILRLEIRDFKGPLKDYSRAERLFPDIGAVTAPNGKEMRIPWYGNFFFILYLLDIAALMALYVPYIKTYFRLKTSRVQNCPLPADFSVGRKVKLKNSVALRDGTTNAIWLRPRGLNLFQVQLMVAKLALDSDGRSIVEAEVRFSSGFPLVMIICLFTAYRLFSESMPKEGPGLSAAQFVGAATVFFAVAGFINVRMLSGRMEKIVHDALSEIRSKSIL